MPQFEALWVKFYRSASAELNRHQASNIEATSANDDKSELMSLERAQTLLQMIQKFAFGGDSYKKSFVVTDPHNALVLIAQIYSVSESQQENNTLTESTLMAAFLKALKSLMVNNNTGRDKCSQEIHHASSFSYDNNVTSVYPQVMKHMYTTHASVFRSNKDLAEEYITTLAAICMNNDENTVIGYNEFTKVIQDISNCHCEGNQATEEEKADDQKTTAGKTGSFTSSGLEQKIQFITTLFDAMRKEREEIKS